MHSTIHSRTDLTYPPLFTLKPFGENIWIVDGEVISFYGLPFSTRMTVVRLENGDLWIHSPIELTPALKVEIDKLGPVKYLLSPNKIHYWWIAEWKNTYPEAQTYATKGTNRRSRKFKNFTFDLEFQENHNYLWSPEIKHLTTKGSIYLEETVFFHNKSHTLILADLIENFEPQKLPWYFKIITKLGGVQAPTGSLSIDQRLLYIFGLNKLKQAIETILEWNPEKIIVAHGKCFVSDAKSELRRAFRFTGI